MPVGFSVLAKNRRQDMADSSMTKEDLIEVISRLNKTIKEYEHNASDRQRLEAALRESEGQYSALAETMSESVVVVQADMVRFCNASFSKLSGYTDEELRTRSLIEFIYREDRKTVVDRYMRRIRGEEVAPGFVFRCVDAQGNIRWVDMKTAPIQWNGEPALLCLVYDITDSRTAQESLRESEERYRLVVENVNDVIWTFDLATMSFSYVSPSAERLWGRSVKTVGVMKMEDVFFPETQRQVAAAFEKLRNHEMPADRLVMAAEHKANEGGVVWMEINASIVEDEEGTVVGFLGVSRDIRERKKAEDALAKVRRSLAEAQRISRMGNWEWSIADNEVYCSEELLRIVGVTDSSFEGTFENFLAVLNLDGDREVLPALIRKTVELGKMHESDHIIIRPDGIHRDIHHRIEPFFDERGRAEGVIGTLQDITAEKQKDRELQNARDQLQQAEKMVSLGRIAAGVAHEILNPLGIISLQLQVLKEDRSISLDVQKDLDVCMDQVSRIVAIADNLKQFSHLSKQEMAPTDVNSLIDDLLKLSASQIKLDEIETEIRLQDGLPPILMDRKRIDQVLFNLLANALSAMEQRESKRLIIETGRRLVGDEEFLRIVVADTGTGINEKELHRIFDPFYTTREQGKGTGLGLYISYGIIHDHRGRIWAENNEWGGASFFVELPVRQEAEKGADEVQPGER